MQAITAEILIKGKPTHVAALTVDGHQIVRDGTWLKMARIFDEPWLDRVPVQEPARWIDAVRHSALQADVFTFAQRLPDTTRRHDYPVQWESHAVADTTDFQTWWDGLPQESRKNVRKSQKRGVRVEPVEFSDELVRGIKAIYDETPVRQGRRFWHYGKTFATVRQQNATYLERSDFIGAYLGDVLIGFIKVVYTGRSGRIMQILAREQDHDKHPTNALLAAAIDLCSSKAMRHLIFGQYVYGRKAASSVTEFKRRNGFHEVLVPRYYVPLTWKGRIAAAAGLCAGFRELLPEPVVNLLLETRSFAYRKLRSGPAPVARTGGGS